MVFIKSLILIVIMASSFALASAQSSDVKTTLNKDTKTTNGVAMEKVRDFAFPNGVDLQFLIKELAREIDLNVLFDPASFRTPGRKLYIDLKNVSVPAALDAIMLQEGFYFEDAGAKTILVAVKAQGTGVRQIGVGVLQMSAELAQYFGVTSGILINTVRNDSPASKAGLKAGDVIVDVDGSAVNGALGIVRAIEDKKEGDISVTIVRDHKTQTVTVIPIKGIQSVL